MSEMLVFMASMFKPIITVRASRLHMHISVALINSAIMLVRPGVRSA